MAKKAAKTKEVVEEVVKEDKKELSFTDKEVPRRGRIVTIRTYSDGKIEEL
jgi:hypothetical protein